MVVAIRPVDGEMDDLIFGMLDLAGLGIAKAKKFDGIVVQPFQHISVMDVADLELPIGSFEGCGRIGIGDNRGRQFEEDQLVPIILLVIEPGFPARRFPAFIPGDQKPVSYPIEQQKS